jgi:hypothetical protein
LEWESGTAFSELQCVASLINEEARVLPGQSLRTHLDLKAEQTANPEVVNLFFSFDNLEHDPVVVDWKITLPPHLREIEERALSGVAQILSSDSIVQLSAWRVRVSPFRGAVEQEIVADATLNYGGTFKSDTVRAALSQILAVSRPK